MGLCLEVVMKNPVFREAKRTFSPRGRLCHPVQEIGLSSIPGAQLCYCLLDVTWPDLGGEWLLVFITKDLGPR